MADVISRLKLESGEFDSKIKRAAQGIQRLAEECHNAGGVLNVLEEENKKYIQSIGQMETVSKTARGSVAELTAAFMDMKHVYNQMSQEEKNGEVGRELNKQLGILKQRINDGNQEIKDMQRELNGGFGNALDSIAGKFGMNIKQLTGWGAALGAGKAALDMAKDAFLANETQLDEWGRTVQSSQSLYEGFLNALNTTNISGYLSSMDDIVNAAREAYNAMDNLATYNAFTRGSRAGLRSNYSEALNEYKLNPTAETKKALDNANKQLVEGLQQQADLIKQNYESALNNLGVNRLLKGQQLEEFKNLFRSGQWGELNKMKAGYSQGRLLNAGSQYWYGDRVYDGKIQDRFTGKWRVMEEDEKKQFEFARVLSQVNDKQIDAVQALDEQYKNTLDSIDNQNRSYNRLAGNNAKSVVSSGGGRSGGGGGKGSTQVIYDEGSIAWQEQEVQRLTKAWKEAGDAVRDDYATQLSYAKQRLAEMTGGFDPSKVKDINGQSPNLTQGAELKLPVKLDIQSPIQQWQNEIKGLQEAMQNAWSTEEIDAYSQRIDLLNEKINKFSKTTSSGGDDSRQAWSNAASAIGSVGSALQSIEDPSAKVAGIVAQAIATIASAFASALGSDKTTKSNIWAFIGAAAASTASMIATISQIHSATGYAQGGMVKGNSYSGDNIMMPVDGGYAGLNAGEIVLNRSQQGAIASQLQGSNGGLRVTGVLRGEDLLISIDKSARRQGRGELVFWKNQ